jgi:hypothetical protein
MNAAILPGGVIEKTLRSSEQASMLVALLSFIRQILKLGLDGSHVKKKTAQMGKWKHELIFATTACRPGDKTAGLTCFPAPCGL